MKINILTPNGACYGVIRTITYLKNAINDKSIKRPIYLLGLPIHNDLFISEYLNDDVILLDDSKSSRLDLLDEVNDGTIILSAHGTSQEVYDKASLKGLHIIDTICPDVNKIHEIIKEKLEAGYQIIYIGKKGHPECDAVLSLSSNIIMIEPNEAIDIPSTFDNIFISNQTTMGIFEIDDTLNNLKKLYPNLEYIKGVCHATSKRQYAVYNQETVDLMIVVGDKKSHNTKKLVDIALNKGIDSIRVNSLDEVKKLKLHNLNSISITAGTSAKPETFNEILEYLNSL